MAKLMSAAAVVVALLVASPAFAQTSDPGGPGGGGPHGPSGGGPHGPPSGGFQGRPGGGYGALQGQGFHGRDFASFTPAERSHWTGGQWRHAWYNGVFGWWWVLDDEWYFYDEPIYPYPVYVGPFVPPAQGYWYRCADPAGFYPYVSSCPGGWRQVPAQPPEMTAPPTPPPPPPPG